MTDPLARRDWFVDAQARRLSALGAHIPIESLQRQAAADLELLDSVRKAGLLVSKKKERTPAQVAEHKRSLKAEAQAAAIGGRMQMRSLPQTDPEPRGRKLTGVEYQKTLAMSARIRAIGERAGKVKSGASLESGFQYPALARAVAEATVNHGAKRGEYAGKSKLDRDRILFRRLEDICDRSTALLGPWWVK